MLLEFSFKNYRSFRDEASLSMEAAGLGSFKNSLIKYKNSNYLPSVAIYGKNGGGKSNVLSAFCFAVQFLRDAQYLRFSTDRIPVTPFSLDDFSSDQPTEFSFNYVFEGIQYWYGFAVAQEKVCSEYLYHAPKGQKALVFQRQGQEFKFTEGKERRNAIAKVTDSNQLFLDAASVQKDPVCMKAIRWFKECVYSTRGYSDIRFRFGRDNEYRNILKTMTEYAVAADVGIKCLQFRVDGQDIGGDGSLYKGDPKELNYELSEFIRDLTVSSAGNDEYPRRHSVSAKARHKAVDVQGNSSEYDMDIFEESDGTRRLIALAPLVETVLQKGGVLLIDEIDRTLHPKLVSFFIARFQSKNTNPNGAQLIFTAYSTEPLSLEYMRKDQIYLADKDSSTGVSQLYSLSDFKTRTTDNIRKGYLLGKYGAVPNVDIEDVF